MSATLTTAQLAAYAKVRDFKTQFCKAAKAYVADYSITAYQPGQGIEKLGRTITAFDFQRGGAIPGRKMPIPLNYGGTEPAGGPYRHQEYSGFTGVFIAKVTAPCENEAQLEAFLASADHARELDDTAATIDALFQEHLDPFASMLNLDVISLVPMEPDERPADEREVNVIQLRWAVRFDIRPDAPDLPTGTAGV